MSDGSTSVDATLVTVRLDALPVPIHVRTAEHTEALTREFEIIRRSDPSTDAVPSRLHALIDELDGQFTTFTAQPMERLRRAIDEGEPSVDLEFRVPGTVGTAATRLQALLDEADDYCRAGQHLLTLATPPDAVAYRHWFLDQFSTQAAGQPPVPWTAWTPDEEEEDVVVTIADGFDGDGTELPAGWSVEHEPGRMTVHLAGDLDLHLAPPLRELLTQVGGDVATVVADLAAVTFVDSVGISVLIAAYQRLSGAGVAFELIASARVLRTLTIAGVADILNARPADAG